MNQRYLLALVLAALVIVGTQYLFPRATPALITRTDSTATAIVPSSATANTSTTGQSTPASPAAATLPKSVNTPALPSGDTITIQSPRAHYLFSSTGGAPAGVALDSYPSRRPGFQHTSAQLIQPGDRLVRFVLIAGKDTIRLDTTTLSRVSSAAAGTMEYTTTSGAYPVRIKYVLPGTAGVEYLLHTTVEAPTAPAGSVMLVQVAEKLNANEPDTLDDLGHLAISYRPTRGDVQSVGYSKLDTSVVRSEPGPINWVGVRNKYFLLAIRGTSSPFAGLTLQGGPRTGRVASNAFAIAALPLKGGSATFDIYAGPQDFERLQQLGGDLDQVNPYAGWFHGVVQPVAAVVMKVLLWMKRTTHLNYGWVLVLFGLGIRLILWPLNQGAMRTSIKMQRLQPELQALQKKYADDPRKQQEAVMKVYKDHNMSPLSPLMGCLPMLLPMPVLFALYFVFNNTIEFRGVSFLWLPDISLRDPYYITPLLMGASMFLMSWIGMRNAPPNPQAKMMSYMMPVMMTALFLNFASGLNLYYAVQNVAAIPQQWLLARERAKNPPPATTASMPPAGRRRPA